MGRQDAVTTLEKGEGFGFHVLESYHFNDEIKKQHDSYADYFKKMFGYETK